MVSGNAISTTALLGGVLTSLSICLTIILTQSWHGRLTLDGTDGVQKFHHTPTPRVGGLGVVAGLGVAQAFLPEDARSLLLPMLLSGSVAFLFGLAEDVTRRVSVRDRLLATIASGVLAWWLTGVSIRSVDLWGVDTALAWLPVSVAFTAFAIGGVANAVNIIDGFNGLAGGVILIALAAMGGIAYQAGDGSLVSVCLVLGGVTLGFLLVNFPFGKIFLGDGGAYFLGFMLAWVAVLLPARNPGVSPWASLLACAYPILEVLFSISRRRHRNLHPGHPDRLHLHSLIQNRIARKQLPHWPAALKNAAVSPMVWGFSAFPASLAVLVSRSTFLLLAGFVLCAFLYAWFYRRLIRFAW